ncbi:MAG: hypothetical protein HBSAPP03_29230 [Phycisphaerae bacterium]|nr:MAG: hypothetical protein HBSAPP03_29230 [Phycisphaerae bacterium]
MTTLAAQPRSDTRGFTLLEMLISILLIGIVMALVIGGALAVTKAARGAADRAVVGNIKTGLAQFQQEFGFAPPLVKERAVPATQPVSNGPGERRIVTYNLSLGADQAALRVPTLGPTATNPLRDNRYSELTLAYYLAGGLEEKLIASNPNSPPIDGLPGPGLYAPTRDGSFAIPADVKRGGALPSGDVSNRAGKQYQPFVNLGASVKLVTDSADPHYVRLLDRTGVPVRYYRWMSGREQPAGSGMFVVETPADLNVPALVARDYSLTQFRYMKRRPGRDVTEGAALKGATWAIVSAGPNGVFGDEMPPEMTIDQMAAKLGVPGASGAADPVARELEIRALAEEDNIVEVGS